MNKKINTKKKMATGSRTEWTSHAKDESIYLMFLSNFLRAGAFLNAEPLKVFTFYYSQLCNFPCAE